MNRQGLLRTPNAHPASIPFQRDEFSPRGFQSLEYAVLEEKMEDEDLRRVAREIVQFDPSLADLLVKMSARRRVDCKVMRGEN